MENDKVEKVINMIKEMDIKDKLRLRICLSRSSWANLMYDKAKMYEKFDKKLKEIFIVMFTMAKIMEMEQTERNKVALYLVNRIHCKSVKCN